MTIPKRLTPEDKSRIAQEVLASMEHIKAGGDPKEVTDIAVKAEEGTIEVRYADMTLDTIDTRAGTLVRRTPWKGGTET